MKRITAKGVALALGLCAAAGLSAGVQTRAAYDIGEWIGSAANKGSLFGDFFNKNKSTAGSQGQVPLANQINQDTTQGTGGIQNSQLNNLNNNNSGNELIINTSKNTQPNAGNASNITVGDTSGGQKIKKQGVVPGQQTKFGFREEVLFRFDDVLARINSLTDAVQEIKDTFKNVLLKGNKKVQNGNNTKAGKIAGQDASQNKSGIKKSPVGSKLLPLNSDANLVNNTTNANHNITKDDTKKQQSPINEKLINAGQDLASIEGQKNLLSVLNAQMKSLQQ